jgi:glycosyltransferase involved in cell wall biosynthesis
MKTDYSGIMSASSNKSGRSGSKTGLSSTDGAAVARVGRDTISIFDMRDSPWVDGPGRTILEIAEALNNSGFEYIIGTLVQDGAEFGPYAKEAEHRGLSVEPIRERSAHDVRVLRQTLQAIERRDTDIIHTHEFRSDLIGLICARRKGLRLVSTVHGWIANDTKGKIYTILNKLILRFFDRVIVVSEKIRTELIQWKIPERKIVVVPNALRIDHYRIDRTDDLFRRELGLGSDDVIVAKIGRLSAEKGHLDLLQAAQLALVKCDRLRFVLIGIGPEEEALRKSAKQLGIEDRVIFAGYRKEMVRVYNSTDLVVQSSYTEGMPNVILEALLMEIPVVATNVGGTGEIIEHGRSGILIESRRPDVLAAQLIEFVNDRARFRTMARAGRERICQQFNSTRRIERMRAIYEELVASTGN